MTLQDHIEAEIARLNTRRANEGARVDQWGIPATDRGRNRCEAGMAGGVAALI